jgi:hypothetical protein
MDRELRTKRHAGPPADAEIMRQVMKAIASVRFGQVQIIIQDSRVVQIDTTEKVRLA